MSAASPELPPGPPAGGFWRRRLLEPLQRQLVQGVTPRKLAATIHEREASRAALVGVAKRRRLLDPGVGGARDGFGCVHGEGWRRA